jgi:hypothetical protein
LEHVQPSIQQPQFIAMTSWCKNRDYKIESLAAPLDLFASMSQYPSTQESSMNRPVLGPLPSMLLLLSLLITIGCGAGGPLKSVTVSPSAADARNFAHGQVPFSATGTFGNSSMPQPLNNKDITWCVGTSAGACAGNINSGATVTANGVGACVPTFTGTATILAGKATPAMNPDEGAQMSVFGAAQLTCP